MKIINTQLIGWAATPALLNWFSIRFPDGDASYQDVLDALADDDLPDEANWLMDHAGADDCGQLDIATLDGRKHVNHVFAAGKLTVGTSLNIAGWLRAGLSIKASKSLRADLGLIAGWNIRAGGSIQTVGEIRAGTRIDAGMNITAGEGISSACGITAGGDIQSGKEILVGTAYDSTAQALENLDSEDPETRKAIRLPLQKLWEASNGSVDYWDAILIDPSPFGIEAAGRISASASITSATTIKAGDSITAIQDIQAGLAISAGGNVTSGSSLQGGWAVVVEGYIQAGSDITATSIEAKGGIRAEGDVLFMTDLKSGDGILVGGDVRESPNGCRGNISAAGELRVGGEVQCEGNVYAAKIAVKGTLFSGHNVRADGDIITGNNLIALGYVKSWFGNIRAGLGISSGAAIQAARSIQAGNEIAAGYDCGIFAATGLNFSDWKSSGLVTAQRRPLNLVSGYWAEEQDPDLARRIQKLAKAAGPRIDDDGCRELPGENSIIKVIGIGNSGGNSVDQMIEEGLSAVEFAVVDSDPLALCKRTANVRIQVEVIGDDSRAIPMDAGNVTSEQLARIVAFLENADLVFLVAGVECVIGHKMTTTIAKVARERGIFTVAVVTMPCLWRWNRARLADSEFKVLTSTLDSIVVIRNANVLTTIGDNRSMSGAFNAAHQTATEAVRSISQMINVPGLIYPDFEDIRTVMSIGEAPLAVMDSGIASGPDRARLAAEQVVASLVLDGVGLGEAHGVLIIITAMSGLKMKEVSEAMNAVREACVEDVHIAFGTRYDERMGDDMRVTVIAVRDSEPH